MGLDCSAPNARGPMIVTDISNIVSITTTAVDVPFPFLLLIVIVRIIFTLVISIIASSSSLSRRQLLVIIVMFFVISRYRCRREVPRYSTSAQSSSSYRPPPDCTSSISIIVLTPITIINITIVFVLIHARRLPVVIIIRSSISTTPIAVVSALIFFCLAVDHS